MESEKQRRLDNLRRFSMTELRALCYSLDIDVDDLRHETKPDLALDLIHHCERRDMFSDLDRAIEQVAQKKQSSDELLIKESESVWNRVAVFVIRYIIIVASVLIVLDVFLSPSIKDSIIQQIGLLGTAPTPVILLSPTTQPQVTHTFMPTPTENPQSTEQGSLILWTEEVAPVDVFIVLDNSCSMYAPDEPACAGAGQHGDDPKIRLSGVPDFLLLLGLNKPDKSDYRVGFISFASSVNTLLPLSSLALPHNNIIESISFPPPDYETRIIPALQEAYNHLAFSKPNNPNNRSAVVLLTDGYPVPETEQSEAHIETVISNSDEVDLFVVIIEKEATQDRFQEYVQFWQRMSAKYPHITTYVTQNETDIRGAFYRIASQLNSATTLIESVETVEDKPSVFFIGQHIERFTLHTTDMSSEMNLRIYDPEMNDVLEHQPGVKYLVSEDQIVEYVSVESPRLAEDLKNQDWYVSTQYPATLLIARESLYNIRILNPEISNTNVTNSFQTLIAYPNTRPLTIRFALQNRQKEAIRDQEEIYGSVIYPNGQEEILRIPVDLLPDENGVYKFDFEFNPYSSPLFDQQGIYRFIINAGSLNTVGEERIPQATVKLHVDVFDPFATADSSPDVPRFILSPKDFISSPLFVVLAVIVFVLLVAHLLYILLER